jgi:hypothetical protein
MSYASSYRARDKKYLQLTNLPWQAFLANFFDRQLGGLDWSGSGAFSTLMVRLRADVFLGPAFEFQRRLGVRNDLSPLACILVLN